MKEKLYFSDIDSENCYPLYYFIEEAKINGIEEITIIEAIPDFYNKEYIYCSLVGEAGDRSECNKASCGSYESKSGRSVCQHRGNLYTYGEEIKFKVSDYGI